MEAKASLLNSSSFPFLPSIPGPFATKLKKSEQNQDNESEPGLPPVLANMEGSTSGQSLGTGHAKSAKKYQRTDSPKAHGAQLLL